MLVHVDSFEQNKQFALITKDIHRQLSCGWLFSAANPYSGWWIRVATDSILRLIRVLVVGYKLRLYLSYRWPNPSAGFSSCSYIRVATDSILWLTRVSMDLYKLRLTLFHGWLEIWWLDMSYSWLHPMADSSSEGWIRLKANSILRLTTSCSWFYPTADSCSAGWTRLAGELYFKYIK